MGWVGVLSGLERVSLEKCQRFGKGGVYVIYRGAEVVYVGRTSVSLEVRLMRHCWPPPSLLGERLIAGDWDFELQVIESLSAEEAKRVESGLIRELRPQFNTVGIPKAGLRGEAAERYCRRQLARQDKVELDIHRDREAEFAVRAFKGRYGEAERRALAHIYRAAGSLSLDEEMDADVVGEAAYGLFLEGLGVRQG